jgi:hypothetical protein
VFCYKVGRSFIKFKASLQSVIDFSLVCFQQLAERGEMLSLRTSSPLCTVQPPIFRRTGCWNFDIDLKYRYMALVSNVKDVIITFQLCVAVTCGLLVSEFKGK